MFWASRSMASLWFIVKEMQNAGHLAYMLPALNLWMTVIREMDVPVALYWLVSPNVMSKLGGEEESILRSDNYMGRRMGRGPKTVDMFGIIAATMDIHATRLISDLTGVSSLVALKHMFRQVLMQPSKRLSIRLPHGWISLARCPFLK
ncbi:hypothetical protein TNCV_644171 [Trichonephila clavipes]|nr:hypothetical protein TNCV_644171 [Trichonephila clavipes]